MKIALSGRIFETENGMEKSIDEFIKIASEIGQLSRIFCLAQFLSTKS